MWLCDPGAVVETAGLEHGGDQRQGPDDDQRERRVHHHQQHHQPSPGRLQSMDLLGWTRSVRGTNLPHVLHHPPQEGLGQGAQETNSVWEGSGKVSWGDQRWPITNQSFFSTDQSQFRPSETGLRMCMARTGSQTRMLSRLNWSDSSSAVCLLVTIFWNCSSSMRVEQSTQTMMQRDVTKAVVGENADLLTLASYV